MQKLSRRAENVFSVTENLSPPNRVSEKKKKKIEGKHTLVVTVFELRPDGDAEGTEFSITKLP